MGLFGILRKKDSDQLRTLSEKEIQDKLYGGFRLNQEAVQALPEEAKRSGFPNSIPAIQEPAPESQDLFPSPTTSPSKTESPISGEERIRAALDKKKEEMRSASVKFKEWADEEVDRVSNAAQLGGEREKKKIAPKIRHQYPKIDNE